MLNARYKESLFIYFFNRGVISSRLFSAQTLNITKIQRIDTRHAGRNPVLRTISFEPDPGTNAVQLKVINKLFNKLHKINVELFKNVYKVCTNKKFVFDPAPM